jgi:hypothetical protein
MNSAGIITSLAKGVGRQGRVNLGVGVGYYNLIPRRHTSREFIRPY